MLRAAVISSLGAVPAAAMAGPDQKACFTRDWAAVEHSHRDLGAGRVAWVWSWSAEGVADDLLVVDCAKAAGLRARMRSENMDRPLPYDRRVKARRTLETAVAAPHFFSFERLAGAFARVNVPTEPWSETAEPCACATFYPDAFGSEGGS